MEYHGRLVFAVVTEASVHCFVVVFQNLSFARLFSSVCLFLLAEGYCIVGKYCCCKAHWGSEHRILDLGR